MCGIIGSLSGAGAEVSPASLAALKHRGPDAEGCIRLGDVSLGHARLSILDPSPRSDQPFTYGDVTLVYNGELWNYESLREELYRGPAGPTGRSFTTSGDTEVVAAALDAYGADALEKMEGMFALAWTTGDDVLWLARDRFGEVPLHYGFINGTFIFASELKALRAYADGVKITGGTYLAPGTVLKVSHQGARLQSKSYHDVDLSPLEDDLDEAALSMRYLIELGASERRIADSSAPVCTLLSGGIDSAAVLSCLSKHVPNLVAYTAVYNPKSQDLKMARVCADAFGVELREVPVRAPTPDDLASVVQVIEMPHKAQVEIGWACLQLAQAMRSDGFKVTFSGEGSDELWGSYGFAYHGIKDLGWHRYRRNLFYDQHRKNFARCNKVFMAHSIECRLPFLHTPLVEYALRLKESAVRDGKSKPKAVLERAFSDVLPAQVIRRPKVAFQDGMGLKKRIAQTLASPRRFYAAEYRRAYA